MYTRLKYLLLGFALWGTSMNINAHEHTDIESLGIRLETQEVAQGLYMIYGVDGFTGGNLGVSVGKDGMILIDSAISLMKEELMTSLKNISDKPIKYLINTHAHADHVENNALISQTGAQIVAHDNMRQYFLEKGLPTMSGIRTAPPESLPNLTYDSTMTFHFNDSEARLVHTPSAHTDGDSFVYFPKENVIHTGDLFFNGIFPFIDLKSGGSYDGYIAAQKVILALANDETVIIPGHGAVANKSDLEKSHEMLTDSRLLVEKALKKGMSKQEILDNSPLKKHEQWSTNFINVEIMTQQVLSEF